MGPPMDLLISN